MDEKTRRLIETLRTNPASVQALFRSQDGQNLLRLLTQDDRGAALQRAAQTAARGDTSEMVQLVSQVMNSPEGAELISRINQTIKN
ncbi:MAG: hypothetical protein LKJ80_03270 [Oscillibacter sp.]|jgi:hypothetical protein|nr:hypothetical protein [Oscillibacter sp.]